MKGGTIMFTLSAATILGIVAIILTIGAAGCTLVKEVLDGKDQLGEELAKDVTRKQRKAARKQWERTVVKCNGKKYKIKRK